jgi:hypothetical protein
VQVVAAGIADAGMDLLDAGFRLLPVVAEPGLATHRLLRFTQRGGVPFEAVERRVERALRIDFMLGRTWRALQYRERFDVNVNGRRGL